MLEKGELMRRQTMTEDEKEYDQSTTCTCIEMTYRAIVFVNIYTIDR